MNCQGPDARARLYAKFPKPLSIIARKTVSCGSPSSFRIARYRSMYRCERPSHFTKCERAARDWKKRTYPTTASFTSIGMSYSAWSCARSWSSSGRSAMRPSPGWCAAPGPASWTCDSSSARRRSSSSADSLSISSATAGSSGTSAEESATSPSERIRCTLATGSRPTGVAGTSFASGGSAGGSACVVAAAVADAAAGACAPAGAASAMIESSAAVVRIGLIAPRGRGAAGGPTPVRDHGKRPRAKIKISHPLARSPAGRHHPVHSRAGRQSPRLRARLEALSRMSRIC